MILSNKNFIKPTSIKIADFDVEVVSDFKLLGVYIDDSLNFARHIKNTKKIINRKLHSIRKMFFLSFTVKLYILSPYIICQTL